MRFILTLICGLPNFRSSLLTETTQKEAKKPQVRRAWLAKVLRVQLENNLFKDSKAALAWPNLFGSTKNRNKNWLSKFSIW